MTIGIPSSQQGGKLLLYLFTSILILGVLNTNSLEQEWVSQQDSTLDEQLKKFSQTEEDILLDLWNETDWTLQESQSHCPNIGADELCDSGPLTEFTIRGTEGEHINDGRWWWVDENTLGLSNYDGGDSRSGATEIVIRNGFQIKFHVQFETQGQYGFMDEIFSQISTDTSGILNTTEDSFTALMQGGDKLSIDIDSDWEGTARFHLKVRGLEIVTSDSISIDDETYVTLLGAYTPLDSDNDGQPDLADSCPNDPDNDKDGDGICGDVDSCPNDAENDADGDGICGDVDSCPNDTENDADGDGVCGDLDQCPGHPDDEDNDGDLVPDACDVDDDNDGVQDDVEVEMGTSPLNPDSDGDQFCDGDLDVFTNSNIFVCYSGPDPQPNNASFPVDTDGDGIPDVESDGDGPLGEDLDDDGDNISDVREIKCGSEPLNQSSIPIDEDGDFICSEMDFNDGWNTLNLVSSDGWFWYYLFSVAIFIAAWNTNRIDRDQAYKQERMEKERSSMLRTYLVTLAILLVLHFQWRELEIGHEPFNQNYHSIAVYATIVVAIVHTLYLLYFGKWTANLWRLDYNAREEERVRNRHLQEVRERKTRERIERERREREEQNRQEEWNRETRLREEKERVQRERMQDIVQDTIQRERHRLDQFRDLGL
ncbi:MAG: hypothetical protein CMA28_00475 [Euryarchaeota archaeon]|nr:hypothetical protein [Euryarchaeota archaeon]